MRCVTGKSSFENEDLALEALIQNHIRNEYRSDEGPRNVYECNECGNWHFTSKGAKNAVFTDPEIIKRIKNERRGFSWERKLR